MENLDRQYAFLHSIIAAAIEVDHLMISTAIVKALNHHAIACLHAGAGEYRPCEVMVGNYQPPSHYRVPALMDLFVNRTNRIWQETNPIGLGAFVLWRLNHVHPFINGNGRTARALCYFAICTRAGGLLPGTPALPELVRSHREVCIHLLKEADRLHDQGKEEYLDGLEQFLLVLLQRQIASSQSGNV